MKLKVLALGSGILVLLAVAAFAVNRWITTPPSVGHIGDPVMTGVDLASIRRIEIVSPEDKVTLTSDDGTVWRVAEQDDFPVATKKIKGLLLKLTDEKLAHRVTQNPDKLADLGLLTREENGGKLEKKKTGKLVRISDASGQPVFSVLIGNDRTQEGGMAFGGTYVRYPSDSTAYLIGDSLVTDLKPRDWIDTVVLDVDAGKDLKSIHIQRQGRRDTRLSREKPEAPWQLAGMPPDALDQDAVQRVASQLAGLDIFSVAPGDKPAAEVGRQQTGKVTFELFDKRRYTMEIGEAKANDDFRYVTIQAELDPAVDDKDLREQVAAFNKRFEGRLLAVYDWDGKRMMETYKDLRKQPEQKQ